MFPGPLKLPPPHTLRGLRGVKRKRDRNEACPKKRLPAIADEAVSGKVTKGELDHGGIA